MKKQNKVGAVKVAGSGCRPAEPIESDSSLSDSLPGRMGDALVRGLSKGLRARVSELYGAVFKAVAANIRG